MNVEVLGADDIYYGASMNTIFRKQHRRAMARKRGRNCSRFGDDDDMLGVDWGAIGKGFTNIGTSAVNLFKTPGGKAVTAAALTEIAGRLTPTQKAQIAKAQEISGIQPQVFTAGGNTVVNVPEDPFKKNLPLILGGVGLFAAVALVVMKKRA